MNYNINLSKIDILLLASEFIDTNEVKYNYGRWTKEEQKRFLYGLKYFGRNNKLIQKLIKTRSLVQIRSHSQKFLKKIYKKN